MISACEYTEDRSTINDNGIPEESESSSTMSNEPPRKKKRGLFSGIVLLNNIRCFWSISCNFNVIPTLNV